MDTNEIICKIRERRAVFYDSQLAGSSEDPKVHSEADVSRMIADEYDFLLEKIIS